MKTYLTPEIAALAAQDAGNRAMRQGGRSVWNLTDFAAATKVYQAVNPKRCLLCGEPAGDGNALCPACEVSR